MFFNQCTACGGNWGAMLLTGIKKVFPDSYDEVREQKKADRKYLTELVAIKLKAIKEIKENPELLKHLKIATVSYIPTGAHVVVEWKEGFVYSDL